MSKKKKYPKQRTLKEKIMSKIVKVRITQSDVDSFMLNLETMRLVDDLSMKYGEDKIWHYVRKYARVVKEI